MIRIIPGNDPLQLEKLLQREEESTQNVETVVRAIIEDVRQRGDAALREYEAKFDGATLEALEVSPAELEQASQQVEPQFLAVLEQAAANIRSFHAKQRQQGYLQAEQPGIVMGQRVIPLDRVGLYVPGGTARYPSTVLMDAIPAKLAGVGELVMVTPPAADGSVPADILAAARVAGVDRVFKLGGAQAVAALAYGTPSVPRVDKIVGPGNIYVATAKRLVYGQVDIDMIAGPSEILVIADAAANPRILAADLLSQAEHDKLAAAWLVTTSATLAEATARELEAQLATLPRQEIARQAIEHNSAILLVESLEEAAALSNRIAPEHLELCVAEPFALLPRIKHAGSVFLGRYASESLGDYWAGPNHTLPTSGTARFSSPLSVEDFVKKTSFLFYDKAALAQAAEKVALFARHEGLEAHARSVLYRLEDDEA